MREAPEDWLATLDGLLAGDRLAFMKINRLITGFLARWRAYDFRDEWEDLRQEVVLSIVASCRAGRLRDPQAFLAYVRIITRNKVIDRVKSRLRRHERDTLPWEDEIAHLADGAGATPTGNASDLWNAISTLPVEQQRVLDGIYRQGKTYETVSHETGIPLGTMKRRLREALMVLRRRFADDTGSG